MNRSLCVCALVGVAGLASTAMGFISYSGGTYSQNFDSLSNSGTTTNAWTNDSTLPGWLLFQSGSGSVSGTRDNTATAISNYRSDAGGSNAGAIYSWGTAGTP